jgi:hypothetical protein
VQPAEAGAETPAAARADISAEGDTSGEDISMEDVLGGATRKQPGATKERTDDEVPQVETQTYQ